MILLSIDVGIINLGICQINTQNKKILHWDASGIPPMSDKGLFVCLRDHLRNRPWVLTSDKILIEKQPDRNKKMKSVEHFITSYFLCNDKDVQVYDARHKIPDVVGPGKQMYQKRKKMSVLRCEEFIKEHNPEWVSFFKNQKKKDDLADSVMQALSYREIPTEDNKVEKVKKPRKPTMNQKNTVYSRSNLAWIIQNKQPIDKRFEKDLKKYYSNIEELKTEFKLG